MLIGREKERNDLKTLQIQFRLLAKKGVSSYSNCKALTKSAFSDSQERDGGWCEPGELTEQAVASELEGRKPWQVEPSRIGRVRA